MSVQTIGDGSAEPVRFIRQIRVQTRPAIPRFFLITSPQATKQKPRGIKGLTIVNPINSLPELSRNLLFRLCR
jgi:hypothetical protein